MQGRLYDSPSFTQLYGILSLALERFAQPQGLHISAGILYWDEVVGVEEYNIYLNDELIIRTDSTFIDLNNFVKEAGESTVGVQSIGDLTHSNSLTSTLVFNVYSITTVYRYCYGSNRKRLLVEGTPYISVLHALDGYTLDDAYVSITSNGEDITGRVYSDYTITILYIDGDLYIRALADSTVLSVPTNIEIVDAILTWDRVRRATSYEIECTYLVDGSIQLFNTVETYFPLLQYLSSPGQYSIRVKAKSERYEDSDYSSPLPFNIVIKLEAPQNVSLYNSIIHFETVEHASTYAIYSDGVLELGAVS